MERKPIQVDDRTHEIIRLEAVRQSTKPNNATSMCDVVAQFAERLNKKHKYIPEGQSEVEKCSDAKNSKPQ